MTQPTIDPLASQGTVTGVFAGPIRALRSPRTPDAVATAWRSAILKAPVPGVATVRTDGLVGDAQKERRHHGGPTKAVLVYSAAHYSGWARTLGSHAVRHADALRTMSTEFDASQFGLGAFGENLVIDGLDEGSVCLGDEWEIGSCRLRITEPRGPCNTLTRRWMRPALLGEVRQTAHAGWYNAVTQEGTLKIGDQARLLQRIAPRWTIERLFHLIEGARASRADVIELLESPALTEALRDKFTRRLATPGRITD
jgi:MOSC domain-containing protein YiiM